MTSRVERAHGALGAFALVVLLVALSTGVVIADPGIDEVTDGTLRSRLGEKAYRDMGLHKLTDTERERLTQWLDAQLRDENTQATTSAVSGEFGFPEPAPDALEGSETLKASILPPFRGWDGKTVFHLDNGQTWKQRVSGRFTYGGDDRRIEITRNRMGFYEMRLVAENRMVGVKRLD